MSISENKYKGLVIKIKYHELMAKCDISALERSDVSVVSLGRGWIEIDTKNNLYIGTQNIGFRARKGSKLYDVSKRQVIGLSYETFNTTGFVEGPGAKLYIIDMNRIKSSVKQKRKFDRLESAFGYDLFSLSLGLVV